MTREEFEQLLKANNIVFVGEAAWRVAQLVAAAEREACAKVCEDKIKAEYETGKVDHNEMAWTQACAMAIRTKGKE